MNEIALDYCEIERMKELMKNEGRFIHVNMPLGTTEALARKSSFYRTLNCWNKSIENVSMLEAEEVFASIAEEITFINRAK